MKLNILAFAVPLFIGLMLIEYLIAKKKKLQYFNLHNSIANVSIGIAERLSDVLITGMFYFVYDYLQKRFGIFQIKPGVFLWIVLLICTDFLWYWYHRMGHEINLLWAVHVVHHQSEDYNYTVSARITVLQALARTCFWAVLPIIGFPAQMITVMLLVHGIYPFFIHTRLIGKLGVLEYVLVTPSHHRVHHAANEQYLDKNYGDVFIIWDKLFGTFQKEEDGIETVYGLTKPLNTYSFLWQHFHFLIEIFIAAKAQKGVIPKLKIIFGRPEHFDPAVRKKAESIFNIKHSSEKLAGPLNRYVIWQLVILLVSLFLFILFEAQLSIIFRVAFVFTTVLTLINCGAIMESKHWVFHVEFLRLLSLLIVPVYNFSVYYHSIVPIIIVALVVVIISWYRTLQKRYLSLVYSRSNIR
jgi:sterol desaturase/sphingolipid hydroxylase (fatty acid hydroxylase superfamily)